MLSCKKYDHCSKTLTVAKISTVQRNIHLHRTLYDTCDCGMTRNMSRCPLDNQLKLHDNLQCLAKVLFITSQHALLTLNNVHRFYSSQNTLFSIIYVVNIIRMSAICDENDVQFHRMLHLQLKLQE